MQIPNPDLPISISNKTDRVTTSFLDGYEQSSSFAPLKSVTLNYLDRSDIELTNLLANLDLAGGKPDFTWDFRPHYVGKKWQVKSFQQVQYDRAVVEEWSLELMEYPTAPASILSSTTILPNYLIPAQSPTLTTEYRLRNSALGKFPDYQVQPIYPKRQKLNFQSYLTWAQADNTDILLTRSRGVYPLIYDTKTWLCPEWSISYEGEDLAIVQLNLLEQFVPKI